jgi:hypothetical protein
LKKLLLALFISAAIFSSCKKDTGTNVTITGTDLAAINGQLRGTWVFPTETAKIIDSTGTTLAPSQSLPAPALQFYSSAGVNIMPDSRTTLKGTFTLSTDKGFIYLDIVYPDGSTVEYQVLQVTTQTLKLNLTQSYVYLNGNTPVLATEVINTVLKKQNSADITGSLARVSVMSDSVYNVRVYLTHPNLPAPADSAILVNSQNNVSGSYNYSFTTNPGDHLTIDINGSPTKTFFYAYYNGLPLTGLANYTYGGINTTTGWDIP